MIFERLFQSAKRYAHLLLLLPSLKQFDSQLIVEIFFNGIVNMQIENVIPYILRNDVMHKTLDTSSQNDVKASIEETKVKVKESQRALNMNLLADTLTTESARDECGCKWAPCHLRRQLL